MNVFHMTPRQMKDKLEELPMHHSKEEIMALIEALQASIRDDPPGMSFTETAHKHANDHKELFFSYPMLYRTICKGTYRKVVLDILLDAKQAIDSGKKSKKDALEDVIKKSVDEVTDFRAKHKID